MASAPLRPLIQICPGSHLFGLFLSPRGGVPVLQGQLERLGEAVEAAEQDKAAVIKQLEVGVG